MRIGMIGLGIVGGTLKRWFERNTDHELFLFDPGKDLTDDLSKSEAIFISVPVPGVDEGQNIKVLMQCVEKAKAITPFVFIRSTVLPGTNDALGTISMPEFLTERKSDIDMEALPILCGEIKTNELRKIFPNKKLIIVKNVEAELAKLSHNCFGATKVNYFNMIYNIAERVGADYEAVIQAAGLTGYIEKQHTKVPGPDGMFGYGGKCFPQNMQAMESWLGNIGMEREQELFYLIAEINESHRARITQREAVEAQL